MGEKKMTNMLIFGLVGLLAVIFIPGYIRIKKLVIQNQQLEEQIAQIQQANQQLSLEQEKLKNDPVYLEKVAREKLGIAKKGEVVYRVVTPEAE